MIRSAPALAAAGVLWFAAAAAAPITHRMSLIEAIEAVRDEGFEIVYSSRLVAPWMRVREPPEKADALAALAAALAVYRLALAEGPDERWLVVEAEPEARPPAPAQRPRAVEPAEVEPPRPSLEEVVIVASRYTMFDRRGDSDQFLTKDEIRAMPHLADDAFRALHRLPGAAANDFQAPFHLRGGAIEEVKVVIDGLELFEPFHMRSLFSPLSIIDPGIIRDAQLLSGGYAVTYGNHMSGVIDVTTQVPETAPMHELGVSFVSAFARSTGTFDGGRGGYLVSARRGYLDLVADALVDPGEELEPRYGDLFAKVTYAPADTLDVAAHLLLGADDVQFTDPGDGENFGEDSSLRYGWVVADFEPNPTLRMKNMLFAGRVDSTEDGQQFNPPAEDIDRHVARDVEVSGVQSDLTLQLSDTRLWRFGARFRHLTGDFDYRIDGVRQSSFVNNGVPYALERSIQTKREGDEIGAYAAYRFQPGPRLVFETGLRWDKQTYTDTSGETQLSPRLNGLFHLGDRTDLRFSWGRFYQPQGIDELQLADGVTRYASPERADHQVLGLRHRFAGGMELQADAYHKRYANLRPRFENALDVYEYAGESNFDRVRVEPDSARAYGMELTLRKRESNTLDWWVSYTWSQVEDTIGGVDVPRSWDQRHALTANLIWRRGPWTLSALGRYHSGWPRTPLLVLPIVDDAGTIVGIDTDLSQRNDSHYGDYSSVDLRASRNVELARGRFEYYFELFNVFDSNNECCVSDHDLSIGPTVTLTPDVDSYLPLFPSFGFVWTFGPGAG